MDAAAREAWSAPSNLSTSVPRMRRGRRRNSEVAPTWYGPSPTTELRTENDASAFSKTERGAVRATAGRGTLRQDMFFRCAAAGAMWKTRKTTPALPPTNQSQAPETAGGCRWLQAGKDNGGKGGAVACSELASYFDVPWLAGSIYCNAKWYLLVLQPLGPSRFHGRFN